MTELARQQMEKWKAEKQEIAISFPQGEEVSGWIVDFDDNEIVIEKVVGKTILGEKVKEIVICHNWNSIRNLYSGSLY